jgi:hypothetical protein
VSRRLRTNTVVLLGYGLVAYLYFGARLTAHPGRALLGSGADPQIFVWAFAWWPHAIGTWQNPIVSHAIYAPHGIDLAWATTVPLLALAFAPLTLLFGPDVSYNVASMLMPALSAFTAYLLCRYLTRRLWAALVGGYLFGFSSFMLGQELGHMHMTAVFLVPLAGLVMLRYLRSELDGRGLGLRLGVIFGLQLWISTEVLVTMALALLVALALAYWLVPGTRPRLSSSRRPLLGAAGIAAAIASPLLYYALTDFQSDSINAPSTYNADVANFLLPTRLIAIGGSWFLASSEKFAGDPAEQGAYLGLPTLAILVWYALGARRSSTVRFLLAALAVTALVALGTAIVWEKHKELWLPWGLVARLPLFDNVLPARFALYLALLAGVIVALWIAPRRGVASWLLPTLAVGALVPAFWRADYVHHPERWQFFTSKIYEICFPKNENVAIFPFGSEDESTLWQAESGFYFRMPEGYLAPTPPPASMRDPIVKMLTDTYQVPTVANILELARREKVDRIVSVDIYTHPDGTQMHRFGAVQDAGGVLVSPACGYPSMRNGVHPTPPHPK